MFKDYPKGKNITKLSWRNSDYLGQMRVGEIKMVITYFPTNNPRDKNYDSNYCILKTFYSMHEIYKIRPRIMSSVVKTSWNILFAKNYTVSQKKLGHFYCYCNWPSFFWLTVYIKL